MFGNNRGEGLSDTTLPREEECVEQKGEMRSQSGNSRVLSQAISALINDILEKIEKKNKKT